MAVGTIDKSFVDEEQEIDVATFDVPKGYEVIDGELREMPAMGAEASWVASEVHYRFRSHLEQHPIGVAVTAEFSYACFPDAPKLVRKPDVSVILCDPNTYVPPVVNSEIPPALLVEVISPSNEWSETTGRVDRFLDAGTRLAWIIDPERRVAYIQRLSDRNTLHKVLESASLSGEDVLPDFTMALASILPRK